MWLYWSVLLLLLLQCTSDTVCNTILCQKKAQSILRAMDRSVDPCSDFYSFACGNFEETIDWELDPGYLGVMDINAALDEALFRKLRLVIQKINATDPSNPPFVNGLADVFDSCLLAYKDNPMHYRSAEYRMLQQFIVLMGAGILWLPKRFKQTELIERVYPLKSMGLASDFLFQVDVVPDRKGSAKLILQLSTYTNPKFSSVQFENAFYFCDNFELKIDGRELTNILAFKKQIFTYDTDSNDTGRLWNDWDYNERIHPTTVGELKKRYPALNWDKYLTDATLRKIKIRDDLPINIEWPDQFEKVYFTAVSAPPRQIMIYQVVMVVLNILQLMFPLQNIATTKWACQSHLREYFRPALSYLFATQLMTKDEESKAMAKEILSNIRNYMSSKTLRQSQILDQKSLQVAQEKFKNIKTFIGSSDTFADKAKVQNYYANLEIDYPLYNGRVQKLRYQNLMQRFKYYNGDKKIEEFFESADALQTMPTYDNVFNRLSIAAVSFNFRMFSAQLPKITNYAALGFAVIRELFHSIDLIGSQFDESGKLKSWYSKESKHKSISEHLCLKESYNEFMGKSDSVVS